MIDPRFLISGHLLVTLLVLVRQPVAQDWFAPTSLVDDYVAVERPDVRRLSMDRLMVIYRGYAASDFAWCGLHEPSPNEVLWTLAQFRDERVVELLVRETQGATPEWPEEIRNVHLSALGVLGQWNDEAYGVLCRRLAELRKVAEEEKQVRNDLRLELSATIQALALTMRRDVARILAEVRENAQIAEENAGDFVQAEFYSYVFRKKGREFLLMMLFPGGCCHTGFEEYWQWSGERVH